MTINSVNIRPGDEMLLPGNVTAVGLDYAPAVQLSWDGGIVEEGNRKYRLVEDECPDGFELYATVVAGLNTVWHVVRSRELINRCSFKE